MAVEDINNLAYQGLGNVRKSMRSVLTFSSVVNMLLLTSPLFMLQVYDRVLLSRSGETLLFLFITALCALVLLGVIETMRSWMMIRIGARFDRDLGTTTFAQVMTQGATSRPLQDMNQIRNFIASPFVIALFDIPWTPLFLGLVYLLHPMLGHVGLAGAIILFGLAFINDRSTRNASGASSHAFNQAEEFVEHSSRHKDAILGMGMLNSLTNIWSFHQREGLGYQNFAASRNSLISAIAKVTRQVLQVAILAVGAFLAINDVTTPGVMIAASIIMARALAPIEQSIQGWRSLNSTKIAYDSLKEFLSQNQSAELHTTLPVPTGKVEVNNLIVLSQPSDNRDAPQPILSNITFNVNAGEHIGITGPSGSGKSSLIRAILGIVQPTSGEVRVDGAQICEPVRDQFSAFFGYLPQEIELFNGSVAQNIARFREGLHEDIIHAAQLAGAHELILSLPNGYETPIGPSGANLSGGQKQRIALARAVYGEPKLVIFDEPTSNLDNDGRNAFLQCLACLKERKITTFLIAHQPSLFTTMDKLGMVINGNLEKFGDAKIIAAELSPKKTIFRDNVVVKTQQASVKKVNK